VWLGEEPADADQRYDPANITRAPAPSGLAATTTSIVVILINGYVLLSVLHILSVQSLNTLIYQPIQFRVLDQFNFLAGLEATSAVIYIISDYFNPPRRGEPMWHPNKAARISAGILALLSGVFWTASALKFG
jgi:hypothetical protein